MSGPAKSFGSVAAAGLAWSVLQHWGGRGLTFLLFLILARFLSPSQFGVATAAMVVLLLIGTLAEFGFGDAIVQRQDLEPEDINLPFLVSLAASAAIAAVVALNAQHVEAALDVPGLQPVLIAVCAIAPVVTLASFQEMSFRRAIAYRALAVRAVVANLAAGPLAILAALAGWGVWSLVVQTYVATLVGCWWLWRRPIWTPSRVLRTGIFVELLRTGSSLAAARLVDFSTLRVLEMLVISRYGAAAFGLYAIGSRFQTTLAQLMQSAVSDVALSMLSRISTDTPRMAALYVRSTAFMSRAALPVFVCVGALVTDICDLILGDHWEGTAEIARPLLLLGAAQSLQFINMPYLMARGRTFLLLQNSVVRAAALLGALAIFEPSDAGELVALFCWTQLASLPISFVATALELRSGYVATIAAILPAVVACAAADAAVAYARPQIASLVGGPGAAAVSLGLLFLVVYVACFASLARLGRRPARSRVAATPDRSSTLRVGLMWHTLGHSNLGIDALARAHIALISKVAAKDGVPVEFLMLGGVALDTPRDVPANVIVGPSPGMRSFLHPSMAFHRAVRTCDIVFDIGEGDSFTDIYGLRRFLVQCVSKLVVLWSGVPLVLAPQTIGPFEHPLRRWIARAIVRRAKAVYSRGARLLAEPMDGAFTDVAFALPFVPEARRAGSTKIALNVSGLMYHAPAAERGIGIRIDYPALMSRLIDYFEARPNVEIVLFAHVRGSNDLDDDAPAIRELASRHPGVRLAPRFETSVAAKSFLSGMDFVVAGRMHVCIGALSAGVPVAPIAYSSKFSGLFSVLDYPHVVDGKRVRTDEAFGEIVAAFDRRDEIRARIPASLAIAQRLLAGYEAALSQLLHAHRGRG